ncbi:MAG: cadherin domain-containing protein [Porticoccaceae bacterium]|nr:cadherin domain-containing protein [Porticoccaceae bacterium]
MAPVITSGAVANAIEENSGAGQVVYTAQAVDDSSDVTSNPVTYSLSNDSNGAFSIDASSGEVTLGDNPDFESAESYSFTVVAADALGHSTEQAVSLAVVDVFDLNPVFDSNQADPVVNENNELAFTVSASVDPQAGQYGIGPDLVFSLSDDANGVFSVDSATGAVSMSPLSDHETQSQYGFTVVATDDAGNATEKAFGLTVNDLDEIAPTITSSDVADDLNGDDAGQLDENSGSGQVVYTASADDSLDISAGVTFSLSAGSDAALSIDANTGAVTLSDNPDHEAQSSYSFTVVASDGVNPNVTQSVSLDINDLDDTAAIVTSGDSADSIDENSGAGQVIYTATADDSADVSDGVTFSLAAGSDAALSIDANTGAVTLANDPDQETQDVYSFTVVATDAAGNVSTGQSVTLNIDDLDDTAPVITSAVTAGPIDENSGSGQVVYAAAADDSADVNDGTIIFSLSDDSNGLFSIDSATGAVTLSEDPNFETTEGYNFTVVATDGTGNATSQVVALPVVNLDDTAPIIAGPEVPVTLSSYSGANQTVYAPVNDSQGQYVVAFDNPSDVTSEPLSFALSFDGDNAQYANEFAIDAATGAVTYLPNPETIEVLQTIEYTVTATDGAGNSTSVDLQLNISGQEYNVPLFSAPTGYQVTETESVVQNEGTENEEFVAVATAVSGAVDSSVQDGGVIYTAVVSDATPVTYALEGAVEVGENSGYTQIIFNAVSTGHLSINENSGEVTINGVPWVEGVQGYDFAVIVTDSSGNQSQQAVHLDIGDYAVAPVSVDATYSLVEGHDESLVINPLTGEVTLLDNPDREAKSEYSFVVEVNDGQSVRQQAVTLDVSNVDDVAPAITSGDSAGTIDENSGAGQVVYTAVGDDSLDPTGSVAYSLASDSDPALSVDSATGEVTLADDPDHEAQSEYSFTVVATDGAGNASEQAVSLQVNDLDEITPIITSDTSSFSIEENSGADQVVYTAAAHDAASFVEQGPISQQFERNDDGTLTLKLFVDESVASNYPNGLEAIQFALNYAGEESGVFSVNSVKYPSDPLMPMHHEDNGQINFAIIYMSEDLSSFNALKEVNLYETSSDTPIAEINFNIGDASVAGEFTVSEVGLSEYGYNMTYPVGQTVHQYAVNGAGDTTFSLSEDSDSALSIDSATGAVTLSGAVDHEAQSQYSFTVIATDAAGNSAQESVSFSVSNLDEVAPAITSGDTATTIDENSDAGQVIYTATADDSADISGGVTYMLSTDSDTALSIDQATGEVTLADSPDYEAQNQYSFTVIATDAAGHASEQAVTLDIADLDEVASSITSADTAAAIDENSGAAQVVYTATADDSADTSGGVSFSLAAGSDTALSIDSVTGAVTLNENPNFEAQSEYIFTTVATDTAGNASQQTVSLAINDLDEVAATITSGDVAATIDENSGAGQVIYTATADDSADISGEVTYSLVAGSDAALSVDSATGEVSLAADPDYETQNQYSFTVVATDAAGNSAGQAVSLSIADTDEADPIITSVGAVSVSENTGINQVIYTATADDSADVSGGVKFSLHEDSDAGLEIDAQTGDVTLLKNPDVEAQEEYAFTVVAADAAGNSSSKEVSLTVDPVTKVNVTHWGSNIRLGNVRIKDKDGQEIGRSDGKGDKEVGRNFRDGDFTVERDLEQADTDRVVDAADALAALKLAVNLPGSAAQSNNSYANRAENDMNGDGQVTSADFQLMAADVNNDGVVSSRDALQILRFSARMDNSFSSEWKFIRTDSEVSGDDSSIEDTVNYTALVLGDIDGNWTSSEAEQSVKMDHSLQAGDKVYKYDPKSFTFKVDSASEGVFDVNDKSGVVRLSDSAAGEYGFTLVNNRTGAENEISIEVGAADNEAPTFASEGTVERDNNAGNGKVVYTAVATDNGRDIDYSLGDDAPAGLMINKETGDVRLQGNASHNDQPEINFTVIATDENGNSAEQAVTIEVLADPDVLAPTFTSGSVATIDENKGGNQAIYTAETDDSNAAFSLEGPDALSINSNTGVVRLSNNPNKEAQSEYVFTVIATDDAGNSSSQVVTLSVANVDEAAPVITSDDAVEIVEGSDADQVVYTVNAADVDHNGDDTVVYSLAAGSDSALSIDENGAVTLAGNPDYEAQSEYGFTVIATDASGNSSEQTVALHVKNVDDIAPVITSGGVAETVSEGGRAGKVIYTATADDSSDNSGRVTFSLAEGSDSALSINANTGRVRLAHSPDAESQDGYAFTVIATDKSGNSSEQVVTLSVDNVDEIAPTITSGDSAGSVDEHSGTAQVIYTATVATGGSGDAGGDVTYSLATGSDAALSIDASGAVTLNADPDQETQSEYSFTVVATDAAGNASQQPVTLTVNDLDEAAPSITSGDSNVIDENSGAGQAIYTATAHDSADISDGLTLSLADGHDSALSINESGEVILSDNPDYEAQTEYSFTVVATDAAGYEDSQSVTVSVEDLDEVAPTITSGDSAGTIDENTGAQVVYTATSQDDADVSNGAVTYSLADGHDVTIAITADTGVVSLLTNPNHELQSEYSFTIIATDAAGNASEGETVTLSLNDLDEASPTITSAASVVAQDENVGSDVVIYTATADDSLDISAGVTFSLTGDSDSALSVDTSSGEVTLSTDPDYETQSAYSFTVVASDGINPDVQQALTLDINDLDEIAATITSVATVDAINENSGAQVIYTASADDSLDISAGVTFSLSSDSDAALSIDSATGAVSLNADPNYEAQSEYSFTVLASDGVNSAVEQSLTLAINDLDEVAPTITSTDSIIVTEGAVGELYAATADDSSDISAGVTFSLTGDSDSALSIDANTGAVSIDSAASVPGYNFTVVAADGAGNESESSVSVSVADVVSGASPTVTQGDIEQRFTQNSDGSFTLQLLVNDAVITDTLDFVLHYNAADLVGSGISAGQLVAPSDPDMLTLDTDTAGQLAVEQTYFSEVASASVMEVTFELQPGVTATSFTVANVSFDGALVNGSTSNLDIAAHTGTEGADVFTLEAGVANVQSGAGSDIFIATDQMDSSVLVDFESGADSIEMSQLLEAVGYTDADSVSQVSGATPDIADLIASNDGSLDSAFGGYLDDSILTLFVDTDTSAGAVDMQAYEITLGDSSTFEDEDLAVTFSAFIA